MDIVYLILFHRCPDQLFRLIEVLNGSSVFFVVHVCRNYQGFDQLRERAKAYTNLVFCKRERGTWASYGIAKATFNGFETALSETGGFGHLVLLSAQDYPLRSNRAFRDFLHQHQDEGFLRYAPCQPAGGNARYVHPVKGKWTSRDERSRYRFYHLKLFKNHYLRLHDEWAPSPSFHCRLRVAARIGLSRLIPPRSFFGGHMPYFGSQWGVFTSSQCRFVVDEYPEDHPFHNYMKKVFCPDEMFFHTILLNSHHKDRINNRSLHYHRWETPSHPIVFAREHLDELEEARADFFFARKFDQEKDGEILDLLDQSRNTEEGQT